MLRTHMPISCAMLMHVNRKHLDKSQIRGRNLFLLTPIKIPDSTRTKDWKRLFTEPNVD